MLQQLFIVTTYLSPTSVNAFPAKRSRELFLRFYFRHLHVDLQTFFMHATAE